MSKTWAGRVVHVVGFLIVQLYNTRLYYIRSQASPEDASHASHAPTCFPLHPSTHHTLFPPRHAPPLPTTAPPNFLAPTLPLNNLSISAYVLPRVSGNLIHDQPNPSAAVPAQKNPALAPHAHAVGLSMRGVIWFVTIPDRL